MACNIQLVQSIEQPLRELGFWDAWHLRWGANGNAYGRCPFHDDHRASFCIKVTGHNAGVWICYAGCGSGSLHKLFELLGIGKHKADQILARSNLSYRVANPFEPATRIILPPPAPNSSEIVDWYIRSVRKLPVNPHQFAEKWHIQASWWFGSLWVIVPLFDADGNINGFVPRNLLSDYPKYLIQGAHFRARGNVWGIHRVRYYAKPVLIVEGIWDALALDSINVPAVALLGNKPTLAQCLTIAKYLKHVVLAMDADEAGALGAKETFKQIGALVETVEHIKWTPYKDAAEFVANGAYRSGNDKLR